MKTHLLLVALALVAAMLAGCGSDHPRTTKGADAAATGKTASWDATDACALLDKAVVGKTLNDTVTETSLAFVHEASEAEAATSECTYRLASGATATLMARNSPIADNTAEAIAMTRKSTEASVSAFTDEKVEDVTGLGIAAFFVPKIHQLNVFFDSKRFVILTLGAAPADTAKTTAVELARQISR